MAHVGKFYKLWFRRDLAVSLNNYKFAYPEAFVLTISGISSTFFQLHGIDDSLLVNTRRDSTTIREWVGPNTTPPPVKVQPIVEVTDTNWGDEREFHFRLEVSLGFRVLDFKCVSEVPQLRYGTWQARFVTDVIVLDSRINYTPGNFFIKVEAADWSRYNP